jgi:predicted dithiol-disulfide oxidoreductase (DUF899 family)
MTIKPEVLAAIKELDGVHDQRFAPWRNQWQTIRAELLAMDAEISRLRGAISQHRDQFPDEALDGDIALWSVLDAHLSEPRP